uniref:Uncharacterized protein n=1 Tax=Vibrio parahaemolyticus TaxID=670 RepID=A0A7M1W5W7_VIBPH|nr:hypothetical protein VP25_00017 [Vibrio parahaemolyticus]
MNLKSLRKQIEFYSFEWESFGLFRKLYLNKVCFKALFFPYQISVEPSRKLSSIYSVKSMTRADYDSFWEDVFKGFDVNKIKISEVFSFNFNLLLSVKLLVNLFLSLKEYSFFKRLYIILSISRYIGLNFSELNNTSTLICHAEMQPIENYLAEYFKTHNCKTITLQHGLYVDYSLSENINILNYTNISTDYFLSWGGNTTDLIVKYNPKVKVIDCGFPFDNILICKEHSEFEYISVIFDQNIFIKENQLIYNIACNLAKRLGVRLNVRLHPRNVPNDYLFEDSTVFDLPCECSKFVLAHTTSYIVQLMMLDMKVFVFDTSSPKLPFPKEILFRDLDDLNHILEKTFDDYYFFNCSKKFLSSIGQESVNNYRTAIDSVTGMEFIGK